MSIEWIDPVKELDENKVIIRTLSPSETKEVNNRINEKIQQADRVSRLNEIRAVENSKYFCITF